MSFPLVLEGIVVGGGSSVLGSFGTVEGLGSGSLGAGEGVRGSGRLGSLRIVEGVGSWVLGLGVGVRGSSGGLCLIVSSPAKHSTSNFLCFLHCGILWGIRVIVGV